MGIVNNTEIVIVTFTYIFRRVSFGKPADIDMVKDKSEFRNYATGALTDRVAATYKIQHASQTYEFASGKRKQYSALNSGLELSIWEAAELLNDIVDESDPDIDAPQIHHCLQTAEVWFS